jgi:hypothetical protein
VAATFRQGELSLSELTRFLLDLQHQKAAGAA